MGSRVRTVGDSSTKLQIRWGLPAMLAGALIFLTSFNRPEVRHLLREIHLLDSDWIFINEDVEGAELPGTVTPGWQEVDVPHDWAIYGPFDENNDVHYTTVLEDGERKPARRLGRTGGLPHVGVGWYRKWIRIPLDRENGRVFLEFDGAMSNAKIYLNGEYTGEWPYGYSSFSFDITDQVNFGEKNLLAVRLENLPESSRWYPGAGIYRNVRLIYTQSIHVKHWGTYITTPDIEQRKGTVLIQSEIQNHMGKERLCRIEHTILDEEGQIVAKASFQEKIGSAGTDTRLVHKLQISEPSLWSPSNPALYRAVTMIYSNQRLIDNYETQFGFRYCKYDPEKGFFLNGQPLRMRGVNLHHDLGPLGAAVNMSGIKHHLNLLQDMGCNAIRCSHNPPAPELLEAADEMGFLVLDESFDEWKHAKCKNGYNRLWNDWAEKDLVALIHRDRNHPSVIMWSIGNEVREQSAKGGDSICRFLVDICHREDPSRPVTIGLSSPVAKNSDKLAEIVDIVGWNYKPHMYRDFHEQSPERLFYASESASTVSSRGQYYIPAEEKKHFRRTDKYHASSFDLEFPRWATTPDREFMAQDSCPWVFGEFVWTGIDYLGEPTPYNLEWPARSSYFGIIDLAGIPKDRYYLYQSRWTDKEVLHLLPHWNWEGKEGESIPVHCYTSFERAELFVNGKSIGIQKKDPQKLYGKYRLIWEDVPYETGELKVVALDRSGNALKAKTRMTAGEPAGIELQTDRQRLAATGKDLAYVTVRIVDKDSNLCPHADHLVEFNVTGNGILRAVDDGDPTSLESFQANHRTVFNGQAMAIVQSLEKPGELILQAQSDKLRSAEIKLVVE